jgi:hypothetical protein
MKLISDCENPNEVKARFGVSKQTFYRNQRRVLEATAAESVAVLSTSS